MYKELYMTLWLFIYMHLLLTILLVTRVLFLEDLNIENNPPLTTAKWTKTQEYHRWQMLYLSCPF